MSTTKKYEQELEETKRVDRGTQPSGSEEERNAVQEKLSEAKAAFARLKERGGDAIHELKERGDEAWDDFKDKLQDLRGFVESRFEQRKKGDQ